MKRKTINSLFYLIMVAGLGAYFILHDEETTPSNATGVNEVVSLPTELHPVVKQQSDKLVQQAAQKGIVVVITDGFRSAEEQNRLFEQGRSIEGNIVTNAKGGESYHNYGLAIDFALKTSSGAVIWDRQYDGNQNAKADWAEVVAIAKTLGFEWGGDWTQFKDYPHLQIDFGLSIANLQNGKIPDEASLIADTH